jgi:hypothetical protein
LHSALTMKIMTCGLVLAAACTATTISPPLTARGSPDPRRTFGSVHITSGAFTRPHRVIGVVQLTQSGFKWMHEIELQNDARPESLMFNIGRYAKSLGADGVQHLKLLDLDPQTPADTATNKIDSVISMHDAIERKQYASAAAQGTKTRWEIRGELVQFTDTQGAP